MSDDYPPLPVSPDIIEIARHRNGISGAPFHAVLFVDEDGSRKVALLFDREAHCAVLDVDKLHGGDIAFGSNSWRGDRYEEPLRRAVEKWQRAKDRLYRRKH